MTTFVSKTNADLSEFSDSNDEFLKALREKIDAADNGDEESKIYGDDNGDSDGDNVPETKNYIRYAGDEESKINGDDNGDSDGDNVPETKNYSMLTLFTSSREMTLISANVCFQEKFKHHENS